MFEDDRQFKQKLFEKLNFKSFIGSHGPHRFSEIQVKLQESFFFKKEFVLERFGGKNDMAEKRLKKTEAAYRRCGIDELLPKTGR